MKTDEQKAESQAKLENIWEYYPNRYISDEDRAVIKDEIYFPDQDSSRKPIAFVREISDNFPPQNYYLSDLRLHSS